MKVFICSIALCILVSSCYPLEPSVSNSQVDVQISPVNEQDPLLLLFSAQFPNSPPPDLRWDFGDGYSHHQAEITHRYLVPGDYTATLHYSINDTPYKQALKVNILGNQSELLIHSLKAVAIDSDNNDVNQPFLSNNISPQLLEPPIQVSGIVMEPNACQAGKLCKAGDLNDRYSFHLEYGNTILVDIIKGSLNVTISTDLDSTLKTFNNISQQLLIPASQLGQGKFNLNLSLSDNEDRAQYILKIQSPNQETPSSSKNYQPGKLIVTWQGKSQPELIDINDPRLMHLKDTDIQSARRRLTAQPEISHVSLNYIRRIHSSNLYDQWPLTFQNINALWKPLAIQGDLPGANTTVAVIDTGIYSHHPDFKNLAIRDGFDFISDPINALDGNGWDSNPEDPGDNQLSYHGSHVTGIIAAQPNNPSTTNNTTGLAWGAAIMPLRVLGADGGTSYDLIQALRYAAGLKNDSGRFPTKPADIINLSLGGIEFSAAEQATINEVIQSGAIIVAATGNQGREQVNYPAAYQNVIAVGASNYQGMVSRYSNSGQLIDIVAPGGECLDTSCTGGINSAGATGRLTLQSDQRQASRVNLAGTSMAAAHVSALLSIARSSLPSLDAFETAKLLKNGQLTFNPMNLNTPPTFNPKTGWGWLKSEAILELINTSELHQGGIWANHIEVGLTPLQQTELTLITRGPVGLPNLQVQNDATTLKVDIKGSTLKISASADFKEQSDVLISGANMKPLVVKVYSPAPIKQDHNIHHLYLHKSSDAGTQDMGRASIQSNNWHAFIENDATLNSVQASTDIDYDGVYCEPGEFCAFSDNLNNQPTIMIEGNLLNH